jgi:hypothetical protein
MKTLLTLDLIENGKIIKTRRQWSKSWTLGIMQLLYIHHAQVQAGLYPAIAVDGQTHWIDAQVFTSSYPYKGTFRLDSVSGKGGLFIPSGSGTNYNQINAITPDQYLPGQLIGIQAGLDNTPATPADYALKQRLSSGVGPAIVPGTMLDNVSSGDNVDSGQIYGVWGSGPVTALGVGILPTRGYRLSSFKLKLWRTGSPGNIVGKVWGFTSTPYSYNLDSGNGVFNPIASVTIDGNTLPTNSGAAALIEFVLPAAIELNPGMFYAFTVSAPNGNSSNYIQVRFNSNYTLNYRYCYAQEYYSSYSTSFGQVPIFQLFGSASPEIEYSGCEIFGYTVVDPNASFNVRRLFTNNGVSSLSIAEAGMYMAGCKYTQTGNYSGHVWPYCVARDAIDPAIAINPGQVLQITYTPQITV